MAERPARRVLEVELDRTVGTRGRAESQGVGRRRKWRTSLSGLRLWVRLGQGVDGESRGRNWLGD